MPTEIRDGLAPVVKVPDDPSPEAPEYGSLSLTALVGLALGADTIEFDLVPDSVRLREQLILRARALTVFGMLVMTALVTASIIAAVRYSVLSSRLEGLRADVAASSVEVTELERMRRIVSVVNERRDKRFSAVTLLESVHGAVPDGVVLDEVRFDVERDSDQVELVGTGTTRMAVSTLIKTMENAPRFRDVRSEGDISRQRETGRYEFRVVCSLERES